MTETPTPDHEDLILAVKAAGWQQGELIRSIVLVAPDGTQVTAYPRGDGFEYDLRVGRKPEWHEQSRHDGSTYLEMNSRSAAEVLAVLVALGIVKPPDPVVREMAAMYQRGAGLLAVSEAFGRSKDVVVRQLREVGVTIRRRGYPAGRPRVDRTIHGKEMKRMYEEESASIRDIAIHFGLSDRPVAATLRAMGVEILPPGGASQRRNMNKKEGVIMSASSDHTELGHGQVAEFITVEHGDLTCRCGNDATNEGFEMSDAAGNVIAPPGTVDDDGNECNAAGWDGIHYWCGRCGRIIDQRDGRVVGRRSP